MKTKILFINTDISPYTPEHQVSLTGRALTQGMLERGHEIRTFMPRFGIINERRNQLHEVIRLSGMNIIISDTDHPLILKVASVQPARMQVYFIDNDDYFSNRGQYGKTEREKSNAEVAETGEYIDNTERMVFFARGVIETVRKLRWHPDVIYCQGWFAAIAPIYMRKAFGDDPCFRGAKIVLGLYDNAFKTPLPSTFSRVVHRDGVTKSDLSDVRDKPVSCADLCRLSLKFCDALALATDHVDPTILEQAERLDRKVFRCVTPLTDETREQVLDAYHDFFESLVVHPEEEVED